MADPAPPLPTLLVEAAIEALPSVLADLKALFAHKDPAAPDPTDADALAALQAAYASSLAKDDAWLAAHPEDTPG